MTLRDQILARIDETPHRPPTSRDIIQRLYPASYVEIMDALKQLIDARIIDTETGDSGVTYRRAKSSAPAAKFTPAPVHENNLANWPSRKQPLQTPKQDVKKAKVEFASRKLRFEDKKALALTRKEHERAERLRAAKARNELAIKAREARALRKDADKRMPKNEIARSKALVLKHLTYPMLGSDFSDLAGLKAKRGSGALAYFTHMGIVKTYGVKPLLFALADHVYESEHIARYRTEALSRRSKKRAIKRGLDPVKMAADYQSGLTVEQIAKACGITPPLANRMIRGQGITIRSVDDLARENLALKARIAELEARL